MLKQAIGEAFWIEILNPIAAKAAHPTPTSSFRDPETRRQHSRSTYILIVLSTWVLEEPKSLHHWRNIFSRMGFPKIKGPHNRL